MSWWGKILGGSFGYMLGGPLGALLGAAIGHKFDSGLTDFTRFDNLRAGNTERIQTAFFTTSFLVMGHLAKADGRVSESEIAQVQFIMDQMQLTPDQKKAAIALFNEGKADNFDLHAVIGQFRRECGRRRNLEQMFIEIIITTAMADGELKDVEYEILLSICKQLGFSRIALEKIIQMLQAQQHYSAGNRAGQKPHYNTIDDAYRVLGIDSSATDSEVKKAYRKLMSQHHPDKLVARGLPEEMLKIATEKTQEIKAAYEQIKQERKMK
ncbi:MAG TPA: co-chaperone DjlA [Gammaproteobacteria bacterium]|nr:co-chaperone DjlA [Gammaproteobacteria bacterium]